MGGGKEKNDRKRKKATEKRNLKITGKNKKKTSENSKSTRTNSVMLITSLSALFLFFLSGAPFGWKGGMVPPASITFERHPEYLDEGDPPAVFPHLLHEEMDYCFTCHPSIFSPEVKFITHDDFDENRYCAKCHNGKITFSYEDDEFCEKCHPGGGEE